MTAQKNTPAKRQKNLPMSPVRTSGRAGTLTQADYNANVLLVRDNALQRVQMIQALAYAQFTDHVGLIIANNNNIPTPKGFAYIGTTFATGGFLLQWMHARHVANLLAAGTNVKVDLKGMPDNEVSLFMATLYREYAVQCLANVVAVIDNIEKVMPRKLNGRDGAVVGEFRNSFAEALGENNILIAAARALDATVLEVTDITGTFIAGRMCKLDVVKANGPYIHEELTLHRNYREHDAEGPLGIGISVMPESDYWLFNHATANISPGGPFYLKPKFYSSFKGGATIDNKNQTEVSTKKDIDAMNEIEKTTAAGDVPVSCARYLPPSAKNKATISSRRGHVTVADPMARRSSRRAYNAYKQNAYTKKAENGSVSEARAALTGSTYIDNKLAIASGVLSKTKKPSNKDALVNFVVGNTLLDEVVSTASLANTGSKLMSGKAFGIAFYQAIQKHPVEAQEFFKAMASSKAADNGIICETKQNLATLKRQNTGVRANAPKASRILNKGWRKFLTASLPASASNDNKAATAAA